MKPIPVNAVDASAASVDVLFRLADEVCYLSHNLTCMTEILQEKLERVLFPGTTAEGILEGSNAALFCLIQPEDKRSIAFVMNDCVNRASALDHAADEASVAARQLSAPRSLSAPSEVLEDIITNWQAAHKKWRERLDIGDDSGGPESKAEDAAAEALLTYQCRNHSDVQRKVTLFASIEHLGSLGANYPETFFPSLILSEGGTA